MNFALKQIAHDDSIEIATTWRHVSVENLSHSFSVTHIRLHR